MLRLIRQKVQGPIIQVGLGFVILAFIVTIFYAWGMGSTEEKRGLAKPVALVNGYKITGFTFRKAFDEKVRFYKRFYPNGLDEENIKKLKLKENVLEGLISQKLLLEKAKEYGFFVSDKEVQENIQQYPAFQEKGVFDVQRYRAVLGYQGIVPSEFEDRMRDDLLASKVESFIKSNANISVGEAKELFKKKHEAIKAKYVFFNPRALEKEVTPSVDELKKYYEENVEDFKTGEKIKIAYLFYPADKFNVGIKVSDDEIESYYDEHSSEYRTKKRVHFSQILIKTVGKTEKEELDALKAKADEVRKKAVDGEDFKELVKNYSEDSVTNLKDGDMGFFYEGQLIPSLRSAFYLKAGDVSNVLKSPQGYHILKALEVEESKIKPVSEVKESIEAKLAVEKAKDNAYERAAQDATDMISDKTMDEIAKADDRVEYVVSDFFDDKGKVKGVGRDRTFIQMAFATPSGAVSDVLELSKGFYLITKLDTKEPEVIPFEDAEEKVKKSYVAKKSRELAKSRADEFVEAFSSKKKSFSDLAGDFSVKVESTKEFTRDGYVVNIGSVRNISDELFSLSNGDISNVIERPRGYYVLFVENKKPADFKDFDKEKGSLLASLKHQSERKLFSLWMEDVKSKASIEINQEFL